MVSDKVVYNAKQLKDFGAFEYSPVLMKKVKYVDISDSDLTDIEFLRPFTYIEELNMEHNRIKSLEPLEKLYNLKILKAGDNLIEDVDPLCNNIKLEYCDLFANMISDIDGLEWLDKLEHIDLSYNELFNLESFKFMISLKSMDISYNCRLYNTFYLNNHPNLESFFGKGNAYIGLIETRDSIPNIDDFEF
jgi:Leucine-rich repeat (LRR) protein